LNQQFRHRDCGCDCLAAWPFDPDEDLVREGEIPGICLKLVNEHTCIQSNPAMTPEKCPERI
jgi:hypothetical protein